MAGHVGRLVAGHGVVLLVGRGVLLVHDHHPRICHRREDRAAGANHHLSLAGPDPAPLPAPLSDGQAGMEHGHDPGEVDGEPFLGLRGERDLRDQHDRPLALRQRRLDRGQVDLGLA